MTGNLTAFNDTSSGLDLDFDWFGNFWHDIVIFMIVIVLLIALCCLEKLCPSVDCSHSGMTTFMIIDLTVMLALWAIGLANPQWFDQYIILSVLIAVIAVEGHNGKDSTTKVYMILSAFTYTVGGFPEHWLIWTQIPIIVTTIMTGQNQTHASASILIIAFGFQSLTIYSFTFSCSWISCVLLVVGAITIAGIAQRRYETKKLKCLIMSSSFFTFWSVVTVKGFKCKQDDFALYASLFLVCSASVVAPLLKTSKGQSVSEDQIELDDEDNKSIVSDVLEDTGVF